MSVKKDDKWTFNAFKYRKSLNLLGSLKPPPALSPAEKGEYW